MFSMGAADGLANTGLGRAAELLARPNFLSNSARSAAERSKRELFCDGSVVVGSFMAFTVRTGLVDGVSMP
jgi:hypothetical protein